MVKHNLCSGVGDLAQWYNICWLSVRPWVWPPVPQKNKNKKIGAWSGSSGKTPALQVWGPEFKPQCCKTKQNKTKLLGQTQWHVWHMPVVLTTRDAEAKGWLKSKSSRQAWAA
jgi:hypothetical protein